MQALQRAFCQLRLVASTAGSKSSSNGMKMLTAGQRQGAETLWNNHICAQTSSRLGILAQCFSSKPSTKQISSEATVKTYEPASPFRDPGPRRYGYRTKYFTGGVLPRSEHADPVMGLPVYKPKDAWSRKKALFGQNDYIDILGDGSLTPSDLLHGPDWLIGFKGNELQRLSRRMKFEGHKLSILYPSQYRNMKKRIWFLYKKYNRKRGKRIR
ncbi:hypothetical protein BaRGS_00027372 [Batillaria attramentaria]|uniref:Large ribosomal subunit protein mL51 n=1 Tax=Batillaria attramentaria TaxID=370345 RepID=A0ABD0K275_9CAEN